MIRSTVICVFIVAVIVNVQSQGVFQRPSIRIDHNEYAHQSTIRFRCPNLREERVVLTCDSCPRPEIKLVRNGGRCTISHPFLSRDGRCCEGSVCNNCVHYEV